MREGEGGRGRREREILISLDPAHVRAHTNTHTRAGSLGMAAVALGSRMYVIGGFSDGEGGDDAGGRVSQEAAGQGSRDIDMNRDRRASLLSQVHTRTHAHTPTCIAALTGRDLSGRGGCWRAGRCVGRRVGGLGVVRTGVEALALTTLAALTPLTAFPHHGLTYFPSYSSHPSPPPLPPRSLTALLLRAPTRPRKHATLGAHMARAGLEHRRLSAQWRLETRAALADGPKRAQCRGSGPVRLFDCASLSRARLIGVAGAPGSGLLTVFSLVVRGTRVCVLCVCALVRM